MSRGAGAVAMSAAPAAPCRAASPAPCPSIPTAACAMSPGAAVAMSACGLPPPLSPPTAAADSRTRAAPGIEHAHLLHRRAIEPSHRVAGHVARDRDLALVADLAAPLFGDAVAAAAVGPPPVPTAATSACASRRHVMLGGHAAVASMTGRPRAPTQRRARGNERRPNAHNNPAYDRVMPGRPSASADPANLRELIGVFS